MTVPEPSSPDLFRGAVTLPGPLVDAARDGTLVIFAGAGISRGKPAEYPDFEGLVDHLTAGAFLKRGEDEQPDAYLGRVERQQARRQIGEMTRGYFLDNPKPTTPVHEALVHLFPNDESVRIVTTNYEELFEQVGRGGPVYAAPALPRGNDFHGVVHIHGRATDRTSRIVITDSDFGEAYLSEGWARDFIVELYRTHPVLFVGYSHNDVVVSYLARGLGTGPHPKYALVADEVGGTDWEALGVTRIPYPNPGGDHRPLTDALVAWADYARRSEYEHERTLEALLAKEPDDLGEEELSEIRCAIAHPGRVRYFTRHASGMPWIRWARREGFLNPLVGKELSHSVNVGELAIWIGQHVGSPESRSLRALLTEMGGEVVSDLQWRIAQYIRFNPDLSLDELQLWSAVLLQPPINADHLESPLHRVKQFGVPDVALAVLGVFLRPKLSLRRDHFRGRFQRKPGEPAPQESDRIEVVTEAEHREPLYGAYRVVRWLLEEGDPRIVRRLATMAASYHAHSHELYRAVGKGWDHGEDPWGYSVKEIGPFGPEHEVPDDGEEFLVRLAVSAHDALRKLDAGEAEILLKQWASSGYPVLIRIALQIERQDGDPSRVLDFVSSHPELFRWGASVRRHARRSRNTTKARRPRLKNV